MLMEELFFYQIFPEGRSTQIRSRGVVVPLVALLLTVIVGMAALAIDQSMHQTSAKHLQYLADAAAHAAAIELNGTPEGWEKAKEAALAILRHGYVLGEKQQLSSLRLTRRPDEDDNQLEIGSGPALQGIAGNVDNINVIVERGGYWPAYQDSASPSTQEDEDFQSFEDRVHGMPSRIKVEPWAVANAVRVRISLSEFRTIFANIWNISVFQPTTRTAIGVFDTAGSDCVAPLAIPACQLLFDYTSDGTNPDLPPYYDRKFDPVKQCQRELVLTDGRPLEDDPSVPLDEHREDGIVRSSFYPRLPKDPSTGKAYRLAYYDFLGVLGLPGDQVQGNPPVVTDEQMGRHFIEMANGTRRNCVKVRLGERFHPLEKASLLNGQFFDTRPGNSSLPPTQLEIALGQLINGGNPESFRNNFVTLSSPNPNFPHLRQTFEDTYFLYGTAGQLLNAGLSADMSESMWTNPMCHSSQIPINDLQRARVWKTKAMLIAPSSAQWNDSYCWFEAFADPAKFTAQAQQATEQSEPIIVGTVEILVYDFNIRMLDDTPKFGSYVDHGPEYFFGATYQATPGITYEERIQVPPMPTDPPTECAYTPENCSKSVMWGRPKLSVDYCNLSDEEFAKTKIDARSITYPWDLVSVHCGPSRQIYCPPFPYNAASDPRCLIQPLQSSVGCGGLRARLSCDEKTIPGIHKPRESQPGLVPALSPTT